MIELLANGSEFDGRRVSVIGVVITDSAGGYLFPSRELLQMADTASAIVLHGDRSTLAKLAAQDRAFVLISGCYRASQRELPDNVVVIGNRQEAGEIDVEDFVPWEMIFGDQVPR
jgi:hypothetical protein